MLIAVNAWSTRSHSHAEICMHSHYPLLHINIICQGQPSHCYSSCHYSPKHLPLLNIVNQMFSFSQQKNFHCMHVSPVVALTVIFHLVITTPYTIHHAPVHSRFLQYMMAHPICQLFWYSYASITNVIIDHYLHDYTHWMSWTSPLHHIWSFSVLPSHIRIRVLLITMHEFLPWYWSFDTSSAMVQCALFVLLTKQTTELPPSCSANVLYSSDWHTLHQTICCYT